MPGTEMNSMIPGTFLPFEYSVRINPRAKRVTLRITPRDGLVVVVPKGFKKDRIPAIIEGRRTWIEKALSKVSPPGISAGDATPPDSFLFLSLDKHLELTGDDVLLRLRALAERHLVPWAWNVSEEIGLRPEMFSIRNQKSLWGSCSSKGKINLNQKLLFLEPHLVRYVILHELCHLEHKNHSPRFWAYLKGFEPRCLVHRRELRTAQWTIPAWAH
ncbi:MAG: SprT family zinc-dependent metalloprotease [Thermovirga sp.]